MTQVFILSVQNLSAETLDAPKGVFTSLDTAKAAVGDHIEWAHYPAGDGDYWQEVTEDAGQWVIFSRELQ